MIDIHCHILPDLDDGPRGREQALAMLRLAGERGTAAMIATPHANFEFEFDPAAVEARLADLREASGGMPRLYSGCELHVTAENIEDALRFPARYALAQRNFLLVEFADFSIPKSASQILDRLMSAGLRPIVAHPERNPILRRQVGGLAAWVERGCLTQLTASSLTGRFGRNAKAASEELIERGLAHFLASDAHDAKHRPPVLDEGWRAVERTFGRPVAERLLVTNPRAVLEGRDIPAVVPARRVKSRFAFW